jgi:hypothetical protein
LDWVDHASGRWFVAGAQKSYRKCQEIRQIGFLLREGLRVSGFSKGLRHVGFYRDPEGAAWSRFL